jgi:hypothetical protein
MLRTHRTAMLAKIEGTYGTDSLPTGAADAVLLQDATIVPLDAERVTLPRLRPWLGNRETALASRRVRVQATVDLAGAGAAGSVPPFGPLLRACGMAQTIAAGTSVTYAPVSTGEESVTLYWHQDSQRHRGLGARGTWSLEIRGGAWPRLSLDLTAIYARPTTEAFPATTLTAWQTPLISDVTNTPTATIDGVAVAIESLTYSHGVTVALRDLVGTRKVQVTGRSPTLALAIEAPALATKHYFQLAEERTPIALVVTQGTAAGQRATLSVPRAQILGITPRDGEGVVMYDLELAPLPTVAGDDEVSLAIT